MLTLLLCWLINASGWKFDTLDLAAVGVIAKQLASQLLPHLWPHYEPISRVRPSRCPEPGRDGIVGANLPRAEPTRDVAGFAGQTILNVCSDYDEIDAGSILGRALVTQRTSSGNAFLRKCLLLTTVTVIAIVAGCLINDELTTLTIRSDGSADWVKFVSNVRSSETGDKRAQELRKFVDEFETRTGSDFVRIRDAGGELLEAQWIEADEPYCAYIKAKLPTAAALEQFWTVKGEQGDVLVQARFTRNAQRRRFSLIITGSRERAADTPKPMTARDLREQQANGISETRIAVTDGQIVACEGFVPAADKRSCLIDRTRIDELLRATTGEVELFVEWEVSGK